MRPCCFFSTQCFVWPCILFSQCNVLYVLIDNVFCMCLFCLTMYNLCNCFLQEICFIIFLYKNLTLQRCRTPFPFCRWFLLPRPFFLNTMFFFRSFIFLCFLLFERKREWWYERVRLFNYFLFVFIVLLLLIRLVLCV